ncbi:MAG: DUF1501 domain-containing protein, partial [Planctomycetes bacterium]|nr:DUF1501 domain-containing protein [Planctomycetota bacterium]
TRTPGLFLGELLPELANRSHLFSIVRSHTTSIDSLSTSIDEGQLKHPGSLKEAFPKPDVILEGENCKVFNRSSEFLQRFGNGSSHQNLDTRLNVVERSLRDQATHRLAHPIQRHSAFARNCRLARQLIESNVKTIQINWSEVETGWATGSDTDWDTHTYNFERLTQSLGPIFDRSLSMLLDDLNDRGLLESTLVVAMGEFGRSPDINNHGGRDDWSSCYSSLWSGAGIRPGQVIGCTNKIGSEIVSSPITPKEIHTTIQHLYGEPKTLTQIHQQSLLLSSLT